MDKYEQTFETWNKVAALYQDKFMNLDLYNESYDFICEAITTSNPKILEIGCGPGNITKYLLSKRPDFDVLGIDIAPNMIDLARKNNPTASFTIMDSRNIDAIKAKYNAVICGFCLPYLSHEDSEKFIADCYKLLEKDGLLYISFVAGEPGDSGFKTGSSGDKVYFYFHKLSDLKAQLLEHGFTELKTFEVKYHRTETDIEVHTILVLEKIASSKVKQIGYILFSLQGNC